MRVWLTTIVGAACIFCAPMLLSEAQNSKTRYQSEYRRVFEDAFEIWVKSMSRAEHCSAGRYDDAQVSDTMDKAVNALFPGLLRFRERAAYRQELERKLPLARSAGRAEARAGTCLMADMLVDASRSTVEMAIEAAAR